MEKQAQMAERKNIFGLNPNVFFLGLVSFLTDVSSEMIFTILPLFLANVLGAAAVVIGFIEGVAESTASLIKAFSGFWSDRIGKNKPFLLIGYVKGVTIVIGLVALGGGTLQVREVIKTKGAVVCEVTDEESRTKTMTKVQKIVSSPLTWGILGGIIALAFAVNAVEFVCSAAIPAVFTQVLSLSNLSTLQYYGYILLYDVFFMLDDLIIFGTAAFALTSRLGDRYAKYSRPVGATILIILGILLLGCLYSNQFDFLKPICSVLW